MFRVILVCKGMCEAPASTMLKCRNNERKKATEEVRRSLPKKFAMIHEDKSREVYKQE